MDNASTDGSVAYLKEHFPGVHLIQLEENLGFAAASNIGARKAKGKWIALLNNDAFPEPGWLEAMMKAADKYPEYSFFSSKLIQANNPNLIDGTGDSYHVSGLAWRRHYDYPVKKVEDKFEEVFSPCAAAAFYPREAYLEVGGLDEAFTSYHEDVDLGFRLRLQGHRCLYVPDAVVKHIGSASYGKQSDTQIYYGHRNLVWSFFQNMPGYLLWKYLPAHLLANGIYLIRYSLRGQSRAIWRAKFDAVRGLLAVLKKRQLVQKTRIVPEPEISRVLEHKWLEPYFLGFQVRAHNR